ncbi:MAG: hypothetical protein LBT75_01875, partial [Bacilli bacterium]|nr:hypothetical protein [Bacilli bacterium]
NFVYLEDIAVVLTLITNHYLKLSQKNKYNILIVLSGEPSLFVYLLEFFQPFFNSGLNISVIYDQCLTKEIIKQFDANVIATNFNIPNIDQFDKKIKIFRLSYIPYQKEINEIYQYINSN